ncbi:MAG TPA: two-component regulator propeller domain-containing protein, partial [Chitinophagaceae bacterium]|nr:two-component regulator propeller domain-containing protein [Chitinophagaceae bacterium]
TASRDVAIIDANSMTYQSFNHAAGLPGLRGANDATEDREGNIWISTPTDGAAIVNWHKGSIRKLKRVSGLMHDSLRAVTTDKKGTVWIGTLGGGIDAVDARAGTITHYDRPQGLTDGFTAFLVSDAKGCIWLAKYTGLEILDPVAGRIRRINDKNGFNSPLITSLSEDNNGRMWVATIAGLHVIDQHAATVSPLGSTNVISMMEDTVGNLWVATQHGILLIDEQRKTMRKLDRTHGLANDFVQSFSRAGRNMYVNSNGGLDIIDPISNTLQHYGRTEGLVSDTVYVVFRDAQGNTWLTGPSNGVDVLDAAQKNILHTDTAGGLSYNNIQDLKQDKDGLLWAAPVTGGINVIDFASRKVKYLNNQPGLRDTSNKTMLVDNAGRIWIGTGQGVYMIDKERKQITPITTAEGLSDNWVTSLLPYKNSVIVGTYKKVTIVTPPIPGSGDSNWHIAIVDKSEGLVRGATTAWATDAITRKGAYLWGDNGLVVINEIKPAVDSSATFITGISVMTQQQQFINKRVLNDKDTLWSGANFFVKGKAPQEESIANRTVNGWDSVTGPYNLPVNLQLPYHQNYLQFQFTQAHLSRQDPALYTYMLEGIDKGWSKPTTNTYTENYLNLSPGDYTFKVASKNSNGNWQRPASVSFKILPPWWQTWWAYTLFALLAIGALRMYIVYRSRKLQRENKLLEEKVQVRTKQLQQSLEDLKQTQTQLVQSEKMASLGELTAGIAHEIQNPLNFINNFADVNRELLAEMSEEIGNGNLSMVKEIAADIIKNEEKINHHGKRADAIVKSMLQHSRSNNNAVREPVNLNKLADEYLRLAYHGLRAKDKSFNASLYTEYDEELSTGVYLIPQDMGRVILNLITNAFYAVTEKKKNSADHVAGDKYEPSVWVITKKTGQKASLTVKDNGSGIPDKVVDKIFQPFFTTKPTGQGTGLGLSMAYDIVKAHGGELKGATVPGEGTSFTIELPMG